MEDYLDTNLDEYTPSFNTLNTKNAQCRRSVKIVTINYLFLHHKNRQECRNYFKLLLSKTNTPFATSTSIYTCRKLNLLLINSIYLVFCSVEM